MKGNTKKLFLDLAFNRENGIDHISDGLQAGDIHLGGNAVINISNATACAASCKEQCTPKAISVTLDYPSNWEEYEEIGIKVMMKRNSEFDNATLLGYPSTFYYSYDTSLGDPLNAKTIAAAIKASVEAQNNPAISPTLWTVVYDESDAAYSVDKGPTLVFIAEDCRYDIDVVAFGPALAAKTVLSEQTEGVLNRHQIQEQFPLPMLLPGENPPNYTQLCKNPCVITISGCTPGCDDNFEEPILSGSARKFNFELWVDQDDEDYAAFKTALETKLSLSCNSEFAAGIVTAAASGANVLFTVTKGVGETITVVNPDGANFTGTVNADPFVLTATALGTILNDGESTTVTLSKTGRTSRVLTYVEGTGLLAS